MKKERNEAHGGAVGFGGADGELADVSDRVSVLGRCVLQHLAHHIEELLGVVHIGLGVVWGDGGGGGEGVGDGAAKDFEAASGGRSGGGGGGLGGGRRGGLVSGGGRCSGKGGVDLHGG